MYFFLSVYKNRAKVWHDYSLGFGTICLATATIATKAITAAVTTTEIDTATTFKAPITESEATNFLPFGLITLCTLFRS